MLSVLFCALGSNDYSLLPFRRLVYQSHTDWVTVHKPWLHLSRVPVSDLKGYVDWLRLTLKGPGRQGYQV